MPDDLHHRVSEALGAGTPSLLSLQDELDAAVRRAVDAGMPIDIALAAASGHVVGMVAALLGGPMIRQPP